MVFLSAAVRCSAELETVIISIERIKEYSEVPQEVVLYGILDMYIYIFDAL